MPTGYTSDLAGFAAIGRDTAGLQRIVWFLGGSSHHRETIHAETCRYAKQPYVWAAGKTVTELVAALASADALMRYDACKKCSPDLSVEIARVRLRRSMGWDE
jgi:hypothetical protein